MSKHKLSNLNLAGKSLLSLLILVLLTFSVISTRWLLADLAISDVKTQLQQWNTATRIYYIDEWNTTLARVNQAVAYRPGEAEHHRLKGLVYEWRRRAPLNLTEGERLGLFELLEVSLAPLQPALDSYRQAINLRPAWPDGWVQLARVKGQANEFDEEFLRALQNAVSLGENENRVQLEITNIAIADWEEISADSELLALALENIQHGLSSAASGSNARAHLALLRRANLIPGICPLLELDKLALRAQRACGYL